MKAIYPDNGDSDPAAVPGVHPGHEGAVDAESFTLEVDDQVFAVSPNECGGTHYTWLSGPNPGYGFGVSTAVDLSPDAHAGHVRDFLALVDPTTGHIEDDRPEEPLDIAVHSAGRAASARPRPASMDSTPRERRQRPDVRP